MDVILLRLPEGKLGIRIPDEISDTLEARLASSTAFTIPEQPIRVGSIQLQASGSGTLRDNRLKIEITFSSGGIRTYCSYENLIRQ